MTFRLAGCAAALAIGLAIAWPASAQDVVYAPPQPITILPSQAGYPTDGSKSAVVWAPEISFGAVFDLLDAGTGRVVYSAPLRWSGHYAWGGDTWIADFSSWQTAGRYRLRVRVAGQKPVETPAFPIGDAVYSQSIELTRRWFLIQRSGFNVPGWHPADDLDDAATRDLSPGAAVWGAISGYRDATGGWHDAGDYNKWVPYGWIGVWALCTAYEDLKPNWRGLGANLPDLLDEAAWEADFLMKMQNADGSFAYAVEGWHPDAKAKTNNPWAYWGPPQSETDNRPHSGDERLLELNWPVPQPKFVARTAAALAKFGRVVAPFDRQKAEAALGAARRALIWLQSAAPAPDAEIVAGELLARLELDRAAAIGLRPAQAADLPTASALVRQLISWHQQHVIPAEGPGAFDYQFPYIPLLAMIGYLRAAPESQEAPMVREALQADGRTFERLAGVTAFGQMTAFKSQGEPDPLPEQWRGYNTYYLGTAVVAAELSTLLGDDDLRTLAQKQFEWVVGRNPLGVSMVVGLGWRNPGLYHTRLATLPNHEDAAIPGGVINGIDGGDGGRPILAVAPPGAGGLTDQWQTNEYWVPNNSWFIYAATELAAAFAPQVAAAAGAMGQQATAPVERPVLPFDPAAITSLKVFPPQGSATDVVRGPDGAWHDRVDGAVAFGVDPYLQVLAQLKGDAQALAAPGASGTRIVLQDAAGNRLALTLSPAPGGGVVAAAPGRAESLAIAQDASAPLARAQAAIGTQLLGGLEVTSLLLPRADDGARRLFPAPLAPESTYERAGGHWRRDGEIAFGVDDLLADLQGLQAEAALPYDQGASGDPYGLQSAAAHTLVFIDPEGTQHRLVLVPAAGRAVAAWNGYVLALNPQAVDRVIEDLSRLHTALVTLDPARIRSVELYDGGQVSRMHLSAFGWVSTTRKGVLDEKFVEQLITAATQLAAEYVPPPAEARQAAFYPAAGAIRLVLVDADGQKQALDISGNYKTFGTGWFAVNDYYVRGDGAPDVGEIPEFNVAMIQDLIRHLI